jgi:hypothetical protein
VPSFAVRLGRSEHNASRTSKQRRKQSPPHVESRGRRFKSCPRYKSRTAGPRPFSERSGGGLLLSQKPLSATCPKALPCECSSVRERMRLDGRGQAWNLHPEAMRPPSSAHDGLGLRCRPMGHAEVAAPAPRRSTPRRRPPTRARRRQDARPGRNSRQVRPRPSATVAKGQEHLESTARATGLPREARRLALSPAGAKAQICARRRRLLGPVERGDRGR